MSNDAPRTTPLGKPKSGITSAHAEAAAVNPIKQSSNKDKTND